MNTTTPTTGAGVEVKTVGRGFTQHRRPISSDWVCLPLLPPDETCTETARTYAELGLNVIPDPHLQSNHALPFPQVEPHWRHYPNARVGLLVGPPFEVLAIKTGPEQIQTLQRLDYLGLLDGCFAQAASHQGTYLLYAPSGRASSQQVGLKPRGVTLIGTGGRIDVTPRETRWLWVDVDAYGTPLDLDGLREVLS